MTILKREHPEICKFLNETNHIENDYVFQLDPEKFFSIPEIYVQEIHDFINAHKEALNALGQEGIKEKTVHEKGGEVIKLEK